jgi:ribose 1,5-bisphosphokinase PhnN
MIGSRGSELLTHLRKAAALTAVCFVLGAVGCAGAGRDTVYVIAKTRSYHRGECSRVRMAYARTMTRQEALAFECKPCPECRPDAGR